MEKRRAALIEFVHSGSPPWTDKYISPKMLKATEDGRVILEAHLDGSAVDPRQKDWGIEGLLVDFAESHAKTLQCRGGLRR